MMVRFFNPGKQYLKYKKDLDNIWENVMARGDLILREDVEEFEEKLAAFVGTQYAVGVNSGTDALLLSLKYLGIGPGDEVITVGHTFHATVEVIHNLGATPILVNVGPDAMMDVKEVSGKINSKTKAIIPVHLMGDMVDMEHLMYYANSHNIPVIEDACQALGSSRGGLKAGAWGKAGAFSFYPAKILGCPGDGGAITTNDRAMAEELKDMRNHYKYNPGKWGFNSRLDNLHAALLSYKIGLLPGFLERRKDIARMYQHALKYLPITLPKWRGNRVWQDYIIRTSKRDELAEYLKEHGIETMKNDYHFPDDLPKPEQTVVLESQTLRLPCNDVLTDDEVNYVIKKIEDFYAQQ